MSAEHIAKTDCLYETDASVTVFTAAVLSCRAAENGYDVVLDRTAFFPGGGGQGCDLGTLDGEAVTNVRSEGDTVLHTVTVPFSVGQTVTGRIDLLRRRRQSAAHTAEHILSSVLLRRYGLRNVGFHLGHEDTTCDFDGFLDKERLKEAEREVNAILRENHPVTAVLPSPKELKTLDYRSKLDLHENVRIVMIGEGGSVDRCACCAPHVTSTGEVGLFYITDAYRYKGGMRIHLLCGEEAQTRVRENADGLTALSTLLSAKPNAADVTAAVERLAAENKEQKAALAALNDTLNEVICRSLPSDRPLCLFDHRDDAVALRRLATLLHEQNRVPVLVCGGEEGAYRFVLCAEEPRPLCDALASRLSLRGGGKGTTLSGTLSEARPTVEEALRELDSEFLIY